MLKSKLLYFVESEQFSYGIVIKAEIIRAVPRLGILEHDAVAVIGLAADNGHAVIVFRGIMKAGSDFPERSAAEWNHMKFWFWEI